MVTLRIIISPVAAVQLCHSRAEAIKECLLLKHVQRLTKIGLGPYTGRVPLLLSFVIVIPEKGSPLAEGDLRRESGVLLFG